MVFQIISAIITNSYLKGFLKGNIYRGKLKNICVPGLNCYSCPGAIGSCPIGSLQAVAGTVGYGVSLYTIGFISLIGVLFGRLTCGFVCPFGLFQDIVYKIPIGKITINRKVDRILRSTKYLILAIPVILLPILLVGQLGISIPYFCKYICPAGTLEGGIPLVLLNEPLRQTIGFLFTWKMIILGIVVISSILIYRPFCKYICPLGAFYSFFNKISFYKYEIDKSKCIDCNICSKSCKMHIEPNRNPNHRECIRCGECVKVCSKKAIKKGFIFRIFSMRERKYKI
ncbi:4Fe-4S binding protein [Schnuerera sp. xch1]|nr:4Fe-4S binding protein [Schnuerera sp. xch1]